MNLYLRQSLAVALTFSLTLSSLHSATFQNQLANLPFATRESAAATCLTQAVVQPAILAPNASLMDRPVVKSRILRWLGNRRHPSVNQQTVAQAERVFIGSESTLQFLQEFPSFGMGGVGKTLALMPYAYQTGNSVVLQHLVTDVLWKDSVFLKTIEFLERHCAVLANGIKDLYWFFGIAIVKSIPTPGELMYGFGGGYRNDDLQRILDFRAPLNSDRPMHRAQDIIAELRDLETTSNLDPADDKVLGPLFDRLEHYARLVDAEIISDYNVSLTGIYGLDLTESRLISVQNILYLGMILECTKPGRLDVERYYATVQEIGRMVQAANLALHLSLESHYQARPVAVDRQGRHLEGQDKMKAHGGPFQALSVVDPQTGSPATPKALPAVLDAIRNSNQLVLAPADVHGDLAMLLAMPEVAQALVERKKDPKKSTLLLLPISTRQDTGPALTLAVEKDLKASSGIGIADVVSAVLINDLSKEPAEELRHEFEAMVAEQNIHLASMAEDIASHLKEKGVPILRCPLGEIEVQHTRGDGFPVDIKTYALAPNRLAFALKLFDLWHTYHLPPIWFTDIDGTIKLSGTPPLSPRMALMFARLRAAGGVVSMATGGAVSVVKRVTLDVIAAVFRSPPFNNISLLRGILLQAVAGSSLNAANPEGDYEFVAGVNLREELGQEKYEALERILAEAAQHHRFRYHRDEMTLAEINNHRLSQCADWPQGAGFLGNTFDDREAGVTFAVTGKETPHPVETYMKTHPELNHIIDQAQVYLQEQFRLVGLPLAARRGSDFQIDITLSKKIIDKQAFAMDKRFAIRFLCKLLGYPIGNTIFSGDNILRRSSGKPGSGKPGNDTSAAQTAAVDLNVRGRIDMENPTEAVKGKDRVVISTTIEGDKEGLLPYGEILISFFENVIPKEAKEDLERRLNRGIAEGIKRQYEQSLLWAQRQGRIFMTAEQAPEDESRAVFLRTAGILIEKGSPDDWRLAHDGLQKAVLLPLDPRELHDVEHLFRDWARRVHAKESRNRARDYKKGTLRSATFHPSDGSVVPLEQGIPSLAPHAELQEAGAGQFREGRVGYTFLLGNEPLSTAWLGAQLDTIRALQDQYGEPIPVCIVAGFRNHAELVAYLKTNHFRGLQPNMVDIEFQGLTQSLDSATKGPFFYLDSVPERPQRHLHGLGGFDAVMTPVITGAFTKRYAEGMRYAVLVSQGDAPLSGENALLTVGRAVESGAEILVSVTDIASASPIAAAPYTVTLPDGTASVMLRPQDVVHPNDRNQKLAHTSPDVLNVSALLGKVGLVDDSGQIVPVSAADVLAQSRTWRDSLSPPIVHRTSTFLTRWAAKRVATTMVDQLLHPLSILTYGLRTVLQYVAPIVNEEQLLGRGA